MASKLGEAYVEVSARLNRLEDGLRAANRMTSQSVTTMQARYGALSQQFTRMGATLTAGITLPTILAGRAAMQAYVEYDSLMRGLTAVAGSASAANVQLTRLKEIAKLPGLGLKEAMQGSTALQAAGLSARNAERALKGFGNALATVGKGKNELAMVNLALSQMAAKGEVMGQDLRQIQEQVPQILQIMLKAFGTADTEVLQKAGITTEEFLNAILPELEKLPPVTSGAQNSIENLQDALWLLGKNMADTFAPAVLTVVDVLTQLANFVSYLPGPVKTVLVGLAAWLALMGPLALGLGQITNAVMQLRAAMLVLAAAQKTLMISVGWIGLAVVGVTTLIGVIWSLVAGSRASADAFDEQAAASDRATDALKKQSDAMEKLSGKKLDMYIQNLDTRANEAWDTYKKLRDDIENLERNPLRGIPPFGGLIEADLARTRKLADEAKKEYDDLFTRAHKARAIRSAQKSEDRSTQSITDKLRAAALNNEAKDVLKIADANRKARIEESKRRQEAVGLYGLRDIGRRLQLAGGGEQFATGTMALSVGGKTGMAMPGNTPPFTASEIKAAIFQYWNSNRFGPQKDEQLQKIITILSEMQGTSQKAGRDAGFFGGKVG